MKIVELRANNFKILKAVRIVPEGNTIQITGKNAQGKSSVIDAIWTALQGAKMLKEIPDPVRHGEKAAVIRLDLGEYIVERHIEGDKNTLKVSRREGEVVTKVSSPQGVLDGFMSSLCIDPTEFLRLEPKKQMSTLIGMVDTEGFLEKNEGALKYSMDMRRDANRDLERVTTEFNAMPAVKYDPSKDVDTAQVQAESTDANNRNSERVRTELSMQQTKSRIAQGEQLIEQLRKDVQTYEKNLATLGPKEDLTVFQTKLQEAIAARDAKNAHTQKELKRAALAETTTAAAKWEKEVETVRTAREKWLEAAKLPLTGISFDLENGQVMYQGTPLRQCSQSEQLCISLMLAMAQSPDLRVIRLRDGNCLDIDSLKAVADLAKKHDFQVWIERVDESGEIGVFIEDGEVKSVDGEAVESAPAAELV